ncbi:MAG: glycerol kinase GlpK [Oscillospiraceae bacterium]|jgi:glycerol kinase
MSYLMSLDSGTTSSRCLIFDEDGNVVSKSLKEFTQIFPQPGWVEHDPMEIWQTTVEVSTDALRRSGLTASDIAAIGITNQRETTVMWDKNTGLPVYNAIVWQCRRTAPLADELKKSGKPDMIRSKTGLVPDAYFSGTKIRWILDNVPSVRERAEKGNILFGTIDTWLIWNLTRGKVHATDYTNASRTMLFNIHTLQWDKELLDLLEIPESILPQVMPTSGVFGFTAPELFGGEIPIAGAGGDQQCALFGQCCFDEGEMKNTYGTGCFLLTNTGSRAVESANGLVSTIASYINGKVSYALEGSIFCAGSAIQWLRDELKIINNSAESEEIARSVEDTGGVYVVPAFTGLGAPYWDPYARGTIIGITRGTTRAHIVRATLESIALQSFDVARTMVEDTGIAISALKVDGGASQNNFLMQFQSSLLGCSVIRPESVETTALGAAYLAGLGVGVFADFDEIRSKWKIGRVFEPMMTEEERMNILSGWNKAVKRSLNWA